MFGFSATEIRGLIHEARQGLKEFRTMSAQMNKAISDLQNAAAGFEETKTKVIAFIESVPTLIAEAVAKANGDDTAAVAAVQAVVLQLQTDGAALSNEIAPASGAPPATA